MSTRSPNCAVSLKIKKHTGWPRGSGTSVLALLKDISGLIAPDMDIVINHVYYEKAVMIIKGDAGRMDDVTAVKNELEKSKHFKNVSIGSTSLAREGARVNFDLRMEVQ